MLQWYSGGPGVPVGRDGGVDRSGELGKLLLLWLWDHCLLEKRKEKNLSKTGKNLIAIHNPKRYPAKKGGKIGEKIEEVESTCVGSVHSICGCIMAGCVPGEWWGERSYSETGGLGYMLE